MITEVDQERFVLGDRKEVLERELALWVDAGKWEELMGMFGQTISDGPTGTRGASGTSPQISGVYTSKQEFIAVD